MDQHTAAFREAFPRVLVVAAVARELAPFGVTAPKVGDWEPQRAGDGVWAVVSGVGRANAAGATAWNLARQPYDCVLNVGVCGALPGTGLELGEVIAATESVFYEEGLATPGGHQDMTGLGFPLGDFVGNRVPCSDALKAHIERAADRAGPIATVATCSGTDAAAHAVRDRTGAVAEAMEGAAVLAVSQRLGIPAGEMRAVSNTTGERERQAWDMQRAVDRLAGALRKLLDGDQA
ncbi:MAG: futalosine hydrolase [Phycisphaerales bacterium]|nr:futalosine hydrolase [Phycisphaerales bacterium]